MESAKHIGLKGKIQITSELPEAKEKFPISRIPSLPHPTRKYLQEESPLLETK